MRKLVMTKGLPGSGKTTWAIAEKERLEKQGHKVVIVCKDDIRASLEALGWNWNPDAEKDVISFRNKEIRSAFAHGAACVISADTNFGKHEATLRALAKSCNASFEVMDFTTVSVQTCIERDALRNKSVGEVVIKQMHNKYLVYNSYAPYVADPSKPVAYICDIDGTLAIHKGRSPYEYAKCDTDVLNEVVADTLRLYVEKAQYTPIYVSGRDAWCRNKTIAWLTKHNLWWPTSQLFMRANDDKRADNIVKYEIFDTHIRNNYNVRVVLDDRDRVVKMWRELGLTCLQVAEGNF